MEIDLNKLVDALKKQFGDTHQLIVLDPATMTEAEISEEIRKLREQKTTQNNIQKN